MSHPYLSFALILSKIDPTDPNVYMVFGGMLVFLLFVVKRKFLIDPKPFRIILAASVILFVLSLLFIFLSDRGNKIWYSALMLPLVHTLFFRLMLYYFRKFYHRDPEDSFWDFKNATTDQDKGFNIIYNIIALISAMILIIVSAKK